MSRLHLLLIGLLLCLWPAFALAAPPPEEDTRALVALADFSGSDAELSRFLSDSLVSDLARSPRLLCVERADMEAALTEQGLLAGTPLSPPQARTLGRALRADRILTGSYLLRDDQLLLTARLLDTRTGLTVPGSSFSLSGKRSDVLGTVHTLARQLHKRLTGVELTLEDDPPPVARKPVVPDAILPAPPDVPEPDALEPLRRGGLIPASVRADDPVSERDLSGLLKRVAAHLPSRSMVGLTLLSTSARVSRLRSLTALVKLLVAPGDIAAYGVSLPDILTPDRLTIPQWGLPFVAAALDQQWWQADQPLRARDGATWGYIGVLLLKMPVLVEIPRPAPRPLPIVEEEYTGLLVDGSNVGVERARSPRILDEEGRVVYPDPKHVPDADFQEDQGMAAYYDASPDAKRLGEHPLRVRALDSTGPGHFDLVVSDADAERILRANRRSHFLWKWAVGIMTDGR